MVNSSNMSKSKARRRSEYDILEESWNNKFGNLMKKWIYLYIVHCQHHKGVGMLSQSIWTPATVGSFK